ncbi:MAG: hypothetical protein FJ313_02060, partial [Gemmatimonadetes bacterium]|nr:hypothetical protein [Gemmatimonadota bacterium]
PDARFLRAAAGAFRGDSILVISAECGNEEVRRRNRGVPFSNRALLDALRRVDDAGLQGHVFLSAGLPFETPAMVNETEALIGRILTSTRAAVTVCPMDLDPGSRLFLEPEALGVTPFLRTFRDFYEDGYTEPRPHYATAHMTEAEILAAVHRLTAAVHGLGG